MKITKADEVDGNSEGFFIHVSLKEAMVLQMILGSTLANGPLMDSLVQKMWTVFHTKLPFWTLWEHLQPTKAGCHSIILADVDHAITTAMSKYEAME
jgi:hypothetical protein